MVRTIGIVWKIMHPFIMYFTNTDYSNHARSISIYHNLHVRYRVQLHGIIMNPLLKTLSLTMGIHHSGF